MTKVVMFLFIYFPLGGVAFACDTSDLSKDKYAFQVATGDSVTEAKKKALDEYFLGKDRVAPVAVYDVEEILKSNNKGTTYEKKINANTNLWIEDFVVRSCKEGDKYKVVVIFAKKNVHYYAPIPKEITLAKLRKMDVGYGVGVYHFVGNFKIEPMSLSVECYGENPSVYCIFPNRPRMGVSTPIIKNYTFKKYHQIVPLEKFEGKAGDIVVIKVLQSNQQYRDPKDKDTEGFLLELWSRDGEI